MITTQEDLRHGRAAHRLLELSTIFEEIATSAAFPCIYSKIPFAQGNLSFAHHSRGEADLVESIVGELRELARAATQRTDAMLVVFVDDGEDVVPLLEDDRDLARSVVGAVLAAEPPARGPGGYPVSPQDAEWMLSLDGLGLFLNFSSPRHRRRRSRNVGPAFTIIAQSRESFDLAGRARASARDLIRRRVSAYDEVAPHPALGAYGDPDNREALQYFLGDGVEQHDITLAGPL